MPWKDKEKEREYNRLYQKKRKFGGAKNGGLDKKIDLFNGVFVRTDVCPITGKLLINDLPKQTCLPTRKIRI